MAKGIKIFSIEDIYDLFGQYNLPKFRADQLLNWLYAKGSTSYDEMTNLPKSVREQLSALHPIETPSLVDVQVSSDGTRKYLLDFEGALVETVGLPTDSGRLTVCCSSQSGCAMNCQFCATGKAGLTRSLYPGEIIDQINVVAQDFNQRVTNVVVMGQGEPFANYQNVLAALRIANHPKLLNIGARHITISTCGIVPGIEKLSREPEQFTLAVSLHSAIQDTRDHLMPGVCNFSLVDLRKALAEYAEASGRRFSFEYALMKGVNDSNDDLDALINYARGMLCHVNLIPLNEVKDSPFKPVSTSTLNHWCSTLEAKGIPASIRRSRGSDVAGACGQLANSKRAIV